MQRYEMYDCHMLSVGNRDSVKWICDIDRGVWSALC